MSETIEQYKCGNCGHDGYWIYQSSTRGMYTSCQKCGSKTYLRVRAPTIDLEWDDYSEGIMCTGWGK